MNSGGKTTGTHTFGFGIVGTGNIAQAHIDAIGKLPNARLVGVTNRSTEKAEAVGREHRVRVYPNLNSLLSDDEIEVVCVCTPSGAHRDPAIAAARAGRHIVVEKPLEVTISRAQEIIDAADAAGVKLATAFTSRFSATYQHVKRTVEDGKLGRLLQGDAYLKWYRSQEYYDSSEWRGTWSLDGGGALMNQAVHDVDLLLWLMGPVQEVFAYADTLNHERIEVEDTLVAVLRYSNGALGTISAATSLYPGQPRSLHVHGDRGTVRVKDGSIAGWQLADVSQEEQDVVVGRFSGQASGTFADPMAMSFEEHRRLIEDFLRAIETDSSPLVDGREGLKAIELIEAIYRSAQSGTQVSVNQSGIGEKASSKTRNGDRQTTPGLEGARQ